jgi:hypothetical protein
MGGDMRAEMTRFDVSSVPLQGAYVAKRCPVRAQNDVIVPGERIPPTPFQSRLFERGTEFEAEILLELVVLHGGAIVIGQDEDAGGATMAAMQNRAPLVLGGRLPSDYEGRRVGRPDILVA